MTKYERLANADICKELFNNYGTIEQIKAFKELYEDLKLEVSKAENKKNNTTTLAKVVKEMLKDSTRRGMDGFAYFGDGKKMLTCSDRLLVIPATLELYPETAKVDISRVNQIYNEVIDWTPDDLDRYDAYVISDNFRADYKTEITKAKRGGNRSPRVGYMFYEDGGLMLDGKYISEGVDATGATELYQLKGNAVSLCYFYNKEKNILYACLPVRSKDYDTQGFNIF